MQDQQYAGMPDLNRVREEEYRPGRRHPHEEQLGRLNHFPAIVSIGDASEINRQQQERRPMTDFGKTGERRRFEFLKQQPIAHDVFDVVRHHRQHRARKEEPKVAVVQRRECDLLLTTGCFDGS